MKSMVRGSRRSCHTRIIVHTRCVSGSENVSTPVQCRTKNPGHKRTRLKKPTNPKNKGMFTRDSSPTCFFITIVYTPYMIELNAAMASPMAISVGVLWGKVLPPLSADVASPASGFERSTREIRMIPISEATTPRNLRRVNLSTPIMAPKTSVQTPRYSLVLQRTTVVDSTTFVKPYHW